MRPLYGCLSLAVLIAGCNTTPDAPAQSVADAGPSPLSTLEPAADAPPVDEPSAAPAAVAADTSAADQAAQAYVNCVIGQAAQSAQAGESHESAIEIGIDACRNNFREARWTYRDTGVSESAADRYGANLLTFVRAEAQRFLDSPEQ